MSIFMRVYFIKNNFCNMLSSWCI